MFEQVYRTLVQLIVMAERCALPQQDGVVLGVLQHVIELVDECLALVVQGEQTCLFQQQERLVGGGRRGLVYQPQALSGIAAGHAGLRGKGQYVRVLVVGGDEALGQSSGLLVVALVKQAIPVPDAGQQHWIGRWQGHLGFADRAGDPPGEGSPARTVDQKSLVKFMK
ncbi:hypothetical protein [Stenotrophomonas sp.]|uniref:hypothetical protein n=1 Tax=Stenotrophomonas sp. TaxID=69392 RepID=UPI0028A6B388|nr:hypothetical protein [Stenotrophomonas sp.]